MKKKFLSILLAICMIISLTPAAFATDDIANEDSGENLSNNHVAKVGDTGYATLQAAINDITTSGEVDILTNIVLNDTDTLTIPDSKTVILDLNGKTISQKKAQTTTHAMITNKGTLTIQDSSTEKTGKISYADIATYSTDNNYASNTIRNEGVLNITGGTIENTSSDNVMNYGYPHAIDVYPGSTTNISGGTVKSVNYDCIRMFCNSDTLATTVNISGGTIINRVTFQDPSAGKAGYGVLNISGGTFETTENVTANVRLLNFSNVSSNMKATISGGTFDKEIKLQNHSSASPSMADWLTLAGGTFAFDVSDYYFAPGYEATISGDNYTVAVKSGMVATNSKGAYDTVTEAIQTAPDGDTVYLLPGTISEYVAPWVTDTDHDTEKSITIIGAENFGTTLTGGMYLGYDDSGCRDHTITVKGIAFEGKGILVASQKNVLIEGNRFTNITDYVATPGSAGKNAISVIGRYINADIKNNHIVNTDDDGINLRNIKTAEVYDNYVEDTVNNSITIQGIADPSKEDPAETVTIQNNTLKDWGTDDKDGRAIRIATGNTVTVTGNVMSSTTIPEAIVKATGVGAVDVSQNYWNGIDPTSTKTTGEEAYFESNLDAAAAFAAIKNYYTDSAKTKLVTCGVAEINGVGYATLQAAIGAIETSGKVVILTDIALSEGVTIAAGKTVTLDLNGNIISRNTDAAVSSAAITNNGNLTIQDSSTEKSGKITAFAANPDTAEIPYYANNTITNCGVLTIKSGTIENSTSDAARAAYPIDNNSTSRDAIANIEGGIITGRGAIRQFANSKTSKNEVNITGGTVTGTSYGIWVQNPGDNDPKAALNISGEANVAKVLLSSSANFAVAISSGTISEVTSWEPDTTNTSRNPSAFITGGTFSVDPSDYVAEGYRSVAIGDKFVVIPTTQFVITFQPNGGNFDAATSFTGDGATLAELLEATHSNGNYTFKGWFTAASGGDKVTTDTVFTGDTTIYAQWIDNTPSSGGGGGRNPAPSTPAPEPEVNTPSVDTNAPVVDSTTTENTDGSTTTTDTLENGVVVETTTNTDGSTTETATKTETVETDEGKTTTTTTTTTNTDAAGATVTESTEEVKVETSTGTTTTTTTVTESETKTEKTETVEETVIAEDGTETTTTTSTTETALSNGSTGTTTVDAAGNVEAQVTVSSDAVAEAAQAETPVELAMPAVESSTNTEAAATISVTLPEGTASATVAIPVADGTGEGTVAVIVNADGTETVITDSVVTENGLIVEVPDGATVKVVDNATDFTDVADSDWEKDAVDFTSARGIMQGTSGGENATFDPDTTTTRAMVWTMLARMDGVDTTPAEGEDWWAAGQRWAMENGISDGTMHDADVTREQLVTMLHRFVGAPDSDHDISDYHDDHETSDWALTAKKWAVEMGVMQGSDNYLMPKDDATRAQVAQIFMNFIKNV